jgi:hypothetical protein
MGLLTVPCATEAQPARKVFQIGFLFPGTSAFAAVRLEPFRQRLRDLGYIVVTNFPPPRREGIVVWCVSSYPETP